MHENTFILSLLLQAGTIEKAVRTISSDFLKRFKLPSSNKQVGEKKREKERPGISLVGHSGEHKPSFSDSVHGKDQGSLSTPKRRVQHSNAPKSKVLTRKEVGGGTRIDLIDSLSAPLGAKASKLIFSISNESGPKKFTTKTTAQRKAYTYQKKRSPAVQPSTTTRSLPQSFNPTKRIFLTTQKVVTTSPQQFTTEKILTSTTSSFLDSLPKHLERSGNVYFIPQTLRGETSDTFKVLSKHDDSTPKIERPVQKDPPQAAQTLVAPLVSHSIPQGGRQAVTPQHKSGLHNALPRSVPQPQAPETLQNPPVAPGSRLTEVLKPLKT